MENNNRQQANLQPRPQLPQRQALQTEQSYLEWDADSEPEMSYPTTQLDFPKPAAPNYHSEGLTVQDFIDRKFNASQTVRGLLASEASHCTHQTLVAMVNLIVSLDQETEALRQGLAQ